VTILALLFLQKAGGFVEAGRVNGNLAVSRALGDYGFKDRPDLPESEQQVVAEADIDIVERTVSMKCQHVEST
jgi:protein phosphatase 1B